MGLLGAVVWDYLGLSIGIIPTNSDQAGRAILWRWVSGGGNWVIFDDSYWTDYMTSHDGLKTQVGGWLLQESVRLRDQVHGGHPFSETNVSLTRNAVLDNGEDIIGYQLLHGTNRDVGGFAIRGSIDWDGCKFEYSMHYTWNDMIDPNPDYDSDTWKSIFGQVISLGQASDYRIWITWQADSMLNGSGDRVVSSGWPWKND